MMGVMKLIVLSEACKPTCFFYHLHARENHSRLLIKFRTAAHLFSSASQHCHPAIRPPPSSATSPHTPPNQSLHRPRAFAQAT